MITVRIKENSKQAKALIEMLKTFSFVEIEESPRYNKKTEKAIKEAREDRTGVIDLEDFRKEIYS